LGNSHQRILLGFPSLQFSLFREIRSLIAADNSLFDCLGNLRLSD